MSHPKIDPDKLAAEIAADAEVLQALADNGDVAAMPRPIDLHFKGRQEKIEALVEDAETWGFGFIEFGEYEDGDIAAGFIVESTVEPDVMAALVKRALEIEITHGVEFDGWGCEAQTGNAN